MKAILRTVMCVLFLFSIGCVTRGPITATSNTKTGKLGVSCASYLLFPFLFRWGRNDIQAAAVNGDISSISVVDYEWADYIFYGKLCTLVYGS